MAETEQPTAHINGASNAYQTDSQSCFAGCGNNPP